MVDWPEDCGGIGGYAELAAWVGSGFDDAHLPGNFDDAEHGREWLPIDWHPDHFDLDETNAALAAALAGPVAETGELADLLDQLERRGIRSLRDVPTLTTQVSRASPRTRTNAS